jgi:hypothetical protein
MATQHLQSPTMRVDRDTYASVRSLAGQLQLPMQSVLAKAVEHYRRHLLVEEANAAYTRLRDEIWLVDFEPARGYEQGGQRPAWSLSRMTARFAGGAALLRRPWRLSRIVSGC